jgi:hypothetical protein
MQFDPAPAPAIEMMRLLAAPDPAMQDGPELYNIW